MIEAIVTGMILFFVIQIVAWFTGMGIRWIVEIVKQSQ